MSKGKQMSTRYLVISLALLLLSSGYGLAQTVDPGPIRVGDRWSYEIKDSLTGDLRPGMTVVVAEINDKEITTRVSHRGKDHFQTMIQDLYGGGIDNVAWKVRRPGIRINRPL